jgi:hypothetical protein
MAAKRLGLGVLLMIAVTVVGVTPAAADPQPGAASVGNANFTKAGTTVDVPDVAACSVEGATTASSGTVVKPGLKFGGGTSSCVTTVVDPETEETTTKSTAEGRGFELSALVSAGGPRIRISRFTVTCNATQAGTNASWSFSGVTGITGFPSPVPQNYTKALTKRDGTVLANAVFNIVELPGDGSVGMTMLKITFEPASGIEGSVTVGHTSCMPTV